MIKKIDKGLLFFIAFSCVICVESYKLGLGTYSSPMAGFFPFLVGILLGGLATIALFSAIFMPGSSDKYEIIIPVKRILPLSLAVLAYALLLDKLGFVISTFILVAFLLRVLEGKSWWITISVAIAVSFFTQFFFKGFLRVQLPQGFLG
jgi:putative tricarboxylic transport membrane protein